jgi:shikimate kinase
MSVVWLGGPVGAGKSTLARALRALVHPVAAVALLDEDEVGQAIADVSGSVGEAPPSAARLGALARVLARQGLVVIVSSSDPDAGALAWNRENLPGYSEVYLHASPDTIKHRARRHHGPDGPALRTGSVVGRSALPEPVRPVLSSGLDRSHPGILGPRLGAVGFDVQASPLKGARAASSSAAPTQGADLTIDMDSPEPPELLAFRVGVLVPEFVVAAAGVAGIDARRLHRGA